MISFASVLITSLSLIMNASLIKDTRDALRTQTEGMPPVNPKIIPQLIGKDQNRYFDTFSLADLIIVSKEDYKFVPRKADIDMIIRNIGQSDAGKVGLKVVDENKTLYSPWNSVEFPPLSFEYVNFDFMYGGCHGGEGTEEYNDAKKGCLQSYVHTGIRHFTLVINCNSCQWEENPQCYSFDICVYNHSLGEKWCEKISKGGDFGLKPMSCPEEVI